MEIAGKAKKKSLRFLVSARVTGPQTRAPAFNYFCLLWNDVQIERKIAGSIGILRAVFLNDFFT